MYRVELLDYLACLAGLARLLMFNALADALYEHHVLFREGARNLSGLAFVDSGNDGDGIAFFNVNGVHRNVLHYFRRAGDDRLIAKLLQLARNRSEDAACLWLLLILAAGF